MQPEKIIKFLETLTKTPTIDLGPYINNEKLAETAFEEIEKYISYNFSVFQKIEPVYMFFLIRDKSIIMSGTPLDFNDEISKEESLTFIRAAGEILHMHLGVIISESWLTITRNDYSEPPGEIKNSERMEVITAAFSGISRKLIIYGIKQEDGRKHLERMNFNGLENYEGKLAMNIASFN